MLMLEVGLEREAIDALNVRMGTLVRESDVSI